MDDYEGMVFQNLKVNNKTSKKRGGRYLYSFTCLLCGKERIADISDAKRGKIKDCGNHKPYHDISGQKFGKLTVKKKTKEKSNGKNKCVHWVCICDCGNSIVVPYNSLISGNTKSCGCATVEKMKSLTVHGTQIHTIAPKHILPQNTSGTTGVWYRKDRRKWTARITFQGKIYNLGCYGSKEEAIAVRKEAEKQLFGNFLEWYYNLNRKDNSNRKAKRCIVCNTVFLSSGPRSVYCAECLQERRKKQVVASQKRLEDRSGLKCKKEIETDQIFKSVCDTFRENKKLKETSEITGFNFAVTRKILITEGMYSTEKSEKIQELLRLGMNKEEIMKELHIGKSYYNALIPYKKGSYITQNKSYNATQIIKHRSKEE